MKRESDVYVAIGFMAMLFLIFRVSDRVRLIVVLARPDAFFGAVFQIQPFKRGDVLNRDM